MLLSTPDLTATVVLNIYFLINCGGRIAKQTVHKTNNATTNNSFVCRAPAIIASLFPNLKLSYRSSLGKFNSIGSDILITLRASNVSLSRLSKHEYTLITLERVKYTYMHI